MRNILFIGIFITSLFSETINITPIECDMDETSCYEVIQNIKDSSVKSFEQLKDKNFATLELDKNCKVSDEAFSNIFKDVAGNSFYTKKVTAVKCN